MLVCDRRAVARRGLLVGPVRGFVVEAVRRFSSGLWIMPIAKEGWREIASATIGLGLFAGFASRVHWVLVIPIIVIWFWVVAFFRDPRREGQFQPGQMCAPADGTVTEVTRLARCADVGGPAIRVGIFLSLFNVHINRSPCAAVVRSTHHQPGKYLDARHPDSGRLNESNTLVLDVSSPHAGPVVVRQVAGFVARRIVCHAEPGTRLERGQRFGLIKFGSRTELIVPDVEGTDITVRVGDKVRAGVTLILSQPAAPGSRSDDDHEQRQTRSTRAFA